MAGEDYVLATVVEVEGSGYRKPGARMLVAADGRREGTISGGCLEGEVGRKAFWNTRNGPVLLRYSTSSEDGEIPFGMGCGGAVQLLLERRATSSAHLERLAASFAERRPMAIATILDSAKIDRRIFWDGDASEGAEKVAESGLHEFARTAFEEKRSFSDSAQMEGGEVVPLRAEYIAARPGLFIFGAGDDVLPVVVQAGELGWYTAVVDGRSHLATRARFPNADDVVVLPASKILDLPMKATDAAIVMTHSVEQDTRVLDYLLSKSCPLDQEMYIGVLGPRRRTRELLASVAGNQDVEPARLEAQAEVWMERLHAPMGLDLGGDTPAEIALAVIAEIQKNRRRATGRPLRQVRNPDRNRMSLS